MNRVRTIHDWEELYREKQVETMPWFNPDLDPDIDRALNNLDLGAATGLDIGTGPGTQAIALAEKGFHVTAIDLSDTAVKNAEIKAREKGLNIIWKQDDILNSKLDGKFDVVIDRGCFHVFDPEQRENYVRVVSSLIKPDGYLLLKCFSYKQPGNEGPCRFTPQEIKDIFTEKFKVCDIQETVYQGTLETFPQALFCILKKIENITIAT